MEIIFETSVNLHAIEQTRSRGKRRVTSGLASTRSTIILLVGPICGWLGAKDWNPSLVNIYAVTSILWFFFAVALFGWFLYLGITDKWRRYFVSSVTPGWFWFSVFWCCSASREPST